MLATRLWRAIPWTDFFPLYDQKLNGLSFTYGEAGWRARLSLQQVDLLFYSEGGELSWKTEAPGTSALQDSGAVVF